MKNSLPIAIVLLILLSGCSRYKPENDEVYKRTLIHGSEAREGFIRCLNFVNGWLAHADSTTGLIPENLDKGIDTWNAHNAAADNYSFMVLTSYILDSSLYDGRMKNMLLTERKLTSRINSLPDSYSFLKKDFQFPEIDTARIIFGASEYIKDGLLPLMEYCGYTPWNGRLLEMIPDLNILVEVVDNELFKNPVTADEVNGEMLQTLSRLFWMTGNEKYLEWAIKIGDVYLLTDRYPLNEDRLRLRDHGCEIVGGLSELYVILHFINDGKKELYRQPLIRLMDRILTIGRNSDGMFYNEINPKMGTVVDSTLVDNWGYLYNAYYTLYLTDSLDRYRKAVIKTLGSLFEKYRNYPWEGTSSDGYADALESAINLYNREPIKAAADWIDSEIRVMWDKQQPDGIIEGWHGDGNFARTTLMYCLWKTQGATLHPWERGLELGGYSASDTLYLTVKSTEEWKGRLKLDFPRYREWLHLPIDYPRINQFPEWYTVNEDSIYELVFFPENYLKEYNGRSLRNGIELDLGKDAILYLKIYGIESNY